MDKNTFAIFSPQYELAKNVPKILLLKTLMPDSQNCLLKDSKIVRRKMREKNLVTAENVKVRTPDTYPILHYHTFILRSTGSQYLLAFTKAHIYHWDISGKKWDTKWTNHNITASTISFTHNAESADTINGSGFVTAGFVEGDKITVTGGSDNNGDYTIDSGDGSVTAGVITLIATDTLSTEDAGDSVTIIANCENWETVSYNNKVIATNGIDFVLAWTTTSDFAALDTATGIEYETGVFLTKAKYLTTYENFLILGYTYENGNWYPQRMRWNAIGQETEWIATNSGSAEVGKSDFLKGFGKYQGLLIVFKAKSYYKYWLTADITLVFNGAFISMTIGCRCSKSIVNDDKGRLYWYASDGTFKEISTGTISQPIQTDIVDLIYQTSVKNIRSEFIDETGEVCWSIPFDNVLNNKLLTFKESKWGQVDMAVTAFGGYREP